MKIWKKVAIAGLGVFVAFVALKFTDDSYAALSRTCSFNGGTPAERSLFASTPSCTWSRQLLQRQVNLYGTPERGLEMADRFCRIYKGRMIVGSGSEDAVCRFPN